MITPIFIQLALGKFHDRNEEQNQHITYYSNTCWQSIKARTSFLYLQFFNVFSDWLQLWDKNGGQDLRMFPAHSKITCRLRLLQVYCNSKSNTITLSLITWQYCKNIYTLLILCSQYEMQLNELHICPAL